MDASFNEMRQESSIKDDEEAWHEVASEFEVEFRKACAVVVIQKGWRISLQRWEQRLELYNRGTARMESAVAVVERCVLSYFRAREAKRLFRERRHEKAILTVQKAVRAMLARRRFQFLIETRTRIRAAKVIQRTFYKYRHQSRENRLRVAMLHSSGCSRCGVHNTQDLVYVWDLGRVICQPCLSRASTALIKKNCPLESHGNILNLSLAISLKKTYDSRASKIQGYWRKYIDSCKLLYGTCDACSPTYRRAATHMDRLLCRCLCRRCAQLAVKLFSTSAKPSKYNLEGWRRIEILSEHHKQDAAAIVIGGFIRRAHIILLRRASHNAALSLANRSALHLQVLARAHLSRRIGKACAATTLWIQLASNRILERRPGLWYLEAHLDIIRLIPPFLVGSNACYWSQIWSNYARRAAVLRISHFSKALAARIARGYVSRRRTRELRRAAEQKCIQAAIRIKNRQFRSARTIQSNLRRLLARREFASRHTKKVIATRLARQALDFNLAWKYHQSVWNSHDGFLGSAHLSIQYLLGLSCAFQPGIVKHADQPCLSRAGCAEIGLHGSQERKPLLGQGAVLSIRTAITPLKQRIFHPRLPTLQWPEPLPLTLTLHIVRAENQYDNTDSFDVGVSWCDRFIGVSFADCQNKTGNAEPLIERQDVFHLECDSRKNSSYFHRSAPHINLLRLSIYSKNEVQEKNFIEFDARTIVQLLGSRTTVPFLANKSGKLTLLFGVETPGRTESRKIVSCALDKILGDILHVIPARTAHLKCEILEYQPIALQDIEYGVRACVFWNGDDAGSESIQITGNEHPLSKPPEFILPLRLMPDRYDELIAIESILKIELFPSLLARPIGYVNVDSHQFLAEVQSDFWINVLSFNEEKQLGSLHLRLALHRLSVPKWRRREKMIETFVTHLVDDMLSLLPEPRISISFIDVLELLDYSSNLECHLYWNDALHARWCARCPESNFKNDGLWDDTGKISVLYLPLDIMTIPDAEIRVLCENATLGVVYLKGCDLVNFSGRIQFNLSKAPTSNAERKANTAVTRIVPGRIILEFASFDIPERLTYLVNAPQNVFEDSAGSHEAVNNIATTYSIKETTPVLPKVHVGTTLQFSLLDIIIDDATPAVHKDTHNLLARGNPYAIVKYFDTEIGREEIRRHSLAPLVKRSEFAHTLLTCLEGNLPHQFRLSFTGQPYSLPISTSAPYTNVTIDVFATSDGESKLNKNEDRFLGRATLADSILKQLPLPYHKLPLQRRRNDTLNCAFLKCELKHVTGRSVVLKRLRVAEVPTPGHGLASKIVVLADFISAPDSKEGHPRKPVQSSLLRLETSRGKWPVEEVMIIRIPEGDVDDLGLSTLRVRIARLGASLVQVGCADYSLGDLFTAYLDNGKAELQVVTLPLRDEHGGSRGFVGFAVSIQEVGAFACARSTVASSSRPPLSGDENKLQVKWPNNGGAVANALTTLDIFDPQLLKEALHLSVCNDNGSDAETVVGTASCDLDELVTKMKMLNPKKAFSLRLNETSDEVKTLNLTAWLEKKKILRIGISRIRLIRHSMKDSVYLKFTLESHSVATVSSVSGGWNSETLLYLHAPHSILDQRQMRIELWSGKGSSADLMLGVASASLIDLKKSVPLRAIASITSTNRMHGAFAGIVSFTTTCEEIDADCGAEARSNMDLSARPPVLISPLSPLPRLSIHIISLALVDSMNASLSLDNCIVRLGSQQAVQNDDMSYTLHTNLEMAAGASLEIEFHTGPTANVHLTCERLFLWQEQKLLHIAVGERDQLIMRISIEFEKAPKLAKVLKDEARMERPTGMQDSPKKVIGFDEMYDQVHAQVLNPNESDALVIEESKAAVIEDSIKIDAHVKPDVKHAQIAFFCSGIAYPRIDSMCDDVISQNEVAPEIDDDGDKFEKKFEDMSSDHRFLTGDFADTLLTMRTKRKQHRPMGLLERNELRVILHCGRALPRASGLLLRITGDVPTKTQEIPLKIGISSPVWQKQLIFDAVENLPGDTAPAPALEICLRDGKKGTAFVSLVGNQAPAHLDQGEVAQFWVQLSDRKQLKGASTLHKDEPSGSAVLISMRWVHCPSKSFFSEPPCPNGHALPNCFKIAVVRARNLRAADRSLMSRQGTSDPVVKLSLVSAEGTTMQQQSSRVIKGTTNPVFNELFSFEVADAEVRDNGIGPSLQLMVEDWDLLSKNDFLGKTVIHLASFRNKRLQKRWYALECDNGDRKSARGEILIHGAWITDLTLVFDPIDYRPKLPANQLLVHVLRARGLLAMDSNNSSDAFVRLRLGPEMRETGVVNKSLFPSWREKFAIPVHACDSSTAKLEISVLDWDRLSANDFIGECQFPLEPLIRQRTPYENKSWQSWISLVGKSNNGRPIPAGEVEIALKWIHQPSIAFFDEFERLSLKSHCPNRLNVAVVQARGLPAADASFLGRASSDPYVILMLNGSRVGHTTTKKKTLQPVWREIFAISADERCVARDDPDQAMRLEVSVYDKDMLTMDDLLGSCTIDIKEELSDGAVSHAWRRLCHPKNTYEDCGEIEIELLWQYDPQMEAVAPEPLYQLHICDVSSSIMTSKSDSCLNGEACLGIRASLVDPQTEGAHDDKSMSTIVDADDRSLDTRITAGTKRCTPNNDSFMDTLSVPTGKDEFPFELKITKMVASDLPETEIGASFGLSKQDLYLQASLSSFAVKSMVLRNAGHHASWHDEVLRVPATAESIQDCALEISIFNDNSPLTDVLVGKAQVKFLEQFVDEAPRPFVSVLSRPKKADRGTLSCVLALRRKKMKSLTESIRAAAEQERENFISALAKSERRAVRALRAAERQAENCADPKKRIGLKAAAFAFRKELNNARRRHREALALDPKEFAERGQQRIELAESSARRQSQRKGRLTVDEEARKRDALEAEQAARRANAYLRKQREYCHVQRNFLIDMPKEALGITWGQVMEDELSSLLNERSGFAPESDDKVLNAHSEQWVNTLSIAQLEDRIKKLAADLGSLSAESRSESRALAAEAPHDLAVLDVSEDSRARHLGIRAGLRLVAVDGQPLKSRIHFDNLMSRKIKPTRLTFTERLVIRTERDRLRTLKKETALALKMARFKAYDSTYRLKSVIVDPSIPLGITWIRSSITDEHGCIQRRLEVIEIVQNSQAARKGVRGAWILLDIAGHVVENDFALTDMLRTFKCNGDKSIEIHFLVPREVHKVMIYYNPRVDFGVTWDDRNVVNLILPNSQASDAGVQVGWRLLSISGKQFCTTAEEALDEMRKQASSQTPRQPMIFCRHSDDIHKVTISARHLDKIQWKTLSRSLVPKQLCADDEGDIVVENFDTSAIELTVKRGWRLLEIKREQSTFKPKCRREIQKALHVGSKRQHVEIDLLLSGSDEEVDLEDTEGEGIPNQHSNCTDVPECYLPGLPIVEPSLYLNIISTVDVPNLGRPAHVRIFWCGKQVGRTDAGKVSSSGQTKWSLGSEGFLLPLPKKKVDNAALEKSDTSDDEVADGEDDNALETMISGDLEDAELRLEVWTNRATPLAPLCHGQVLLQGSDLFRQCYQVDDGRAKVPIKFKLMSHDSASKLSVDGSLKIIAFQLFPRNEEAERIAAQAVAKENEENERRRLEVEAQALEDARAPVEAEISDLVLRIENSNEDKRQEAITRFADLAASGGELLSDVVVSLGGVGIIAALMSSDGFPSNQRDGTAALRGLLRDSSAGIREAFLNAGILPLLTKILESRDPSLIESTHEAMGVFAELIDRGHTQQEIKLLSCGNDVTGEGDDVLRAFIDDFGICASQRSIEETDEPPTEVVQCILSIISTVLNAVKHGDARTRPFAARIIAGLTGRIESVRLLSRRDQNVLPGETTLSTLLRLVNTRSRYSAEVRENSLRALSRFFLRGAVEDESEVRAAAESCIHEEDFSSEGRAWGKILIAYMDVASKYTGLSASSKINVSSTDEWTAEGEYIDIQGNDIDDDDAAQSFNMNAESIVYKVQILYATDLCAADKGMNAQNTSDPFLVVLCDGCEVARSGVTTSSLNPIFRVDSSDRNTGFFVEIPSAVVNAEGACAIEYVFQVYDYDMIGKGDFLGEVRLGSSHFLAARGRRKVEPLRPAIGVSSDYIGGFLHFTTHVFPPLPHFTLHILEAADLAIPTATKDSRRFSATQSQQSIVRRLNAGAAKLMHDFTEKTVSPFAVILWGTLGKWEEIGRTPVAHSSSDPAWDEDNIFTLPLEEQPASMSSRAWRMQYNPALRVDVYDMFVNDDGIPTKGQLLGQALIEGPEELTPTSSTGSIEVRLEPAYSGVLKFRLTLADAVPCIHRWIRTGALKKTPPPHAVVVSVLGAIDLACGEAYVVAWLNGRRWPRRTRRSPQFDTEPIWEGKDCTDISEQFVFPLGGRRKGRPDELLLEVYARRKKSQTMLSLVSSEDARDYFLGEVRLDSNILYQPPEYRIDKQLMPRSNRPLTEQRLVGGHLSLHLRAREVREEQMDAATRSRKLWKSYVRNERAHRRTELERTQAVSNGFVSKSFVALSIISGTSLPLDDAIKPWVEIFYNRQRVGLIQASSITEENVEKFAAVWNAAFEWPTDTYTTAAKGEDWPELRIKVWQHAFDSGERHGFLGVATLRGEDCALTKPPILTGRHPVGHGEDLTLHPIDNVSRETQCIDSGYLTITACTVMEESFAETIRSWGLEGLAYDGVILQVVGSCDSIYRSKAYAEITWNGWKVGATSACSADTMRRRDWDNGDFFLPLNLDASKSVLHVTVREKDEEVLAVGAHLGHCAIGYTNEIPPYRTMHTLYAESVHVLSEREVIIEEAVALESEGSDSSDDEVHTMANKENEMTLADIHRAKVRRRHRQSSIVQPPLGKLIVRASRQRVNKPPLHVRPPLRQSHVRLRLSLFGLVGPSPTNFSASTSRLFVLYSSESNQTMLKEDFSIDHSFLHNGEVRHILIPLPANWEKDWGRSKSTLTLGFSSEDRQLAFTVIDSKNLNQAPRHSFQARSSIFELGARGSKTYQRIYEPRLLQPCMEMTTAPTAPLRILKSRLRFQLSSEEITFKEGFAVSENALNSSSALIPLVPNSPAVDSASRLRLLIVSATRLDGSTNSECGINLSAHVQWNGVQIGSCSLGDDSLGSEKDRLFLLPFSEFRENGSRDKSSLVLSVRNFDGDTVGISRLGWNELRRLPKRRTEYLISTPHIDDVSSGMVPLELELIAPRHYTGSDGKDTILDMANLSIIIHLLIEESALSEPHAMSLQINSISRLPDPHRVGCSRLLGSCLRFPYVVSSVPDHSIPTYMGSAMVANPWHGLNRYSSSTRRELHSTQHCLSTGIRKRVICFSNSSLQEVILELIDFGEHTVAEHALAIKVQKKWRQCLARQVAEHMRSSTDLFHHEVAALRIIQNKWRARTRSIEAKRIVSGMRLASHCLRAALVLQTRWRALQSVRARGNLFVLKRMESEAKLKRLADEKEMERRRNGMILSILGCDNLAKTSYGGKSNPYVVARFNGVEIGKTVSRTSTQQPRWDDAEYVLDLVRTNESENRIITKCPSVRLIKEDSAKTQNCVFLTVFISREEWDSVLANLIPMEFLSRDVAASNVFAVARLGKHQYTAPLRKHDEVERIDGTMLALRLALQDDLVESELLHQLAALPMLDELFFEIWINLNETNLCIFSGSSHFLSFEPSFTLPLTMRVDADFREAFAKKGSSINFAGKADLQVQLRCSLTDSASSAIASAAAEKKLMKYYSSDEDISSPIFVLPKAPYQVRIGRMSINCVGNTHPTEVLNLYLRARLVEGRWVKTSSIEGGGCTTVWSNEDLLVMDVRYDLNTYSGIEIELVDDNTPDPDRVLARDTIPFCTIFERSLDQSIFSRWYRYSGLLLAESEPQHEIEIHLSAILMSSNESIPPFPRIIKRLTEEKPNVGNDIYSQNDHTQKTNVRGQYSGYELHIFNINTGALSQVSGSASTWRRRTFYCIAKLESRSSRTSSVDGVNSCIWNDEIVLHITDAQQLESFDWMLTLEIWSSNSPAKDIHLGSVSVSFKNCLDKVGDMMELSGAIKWHKKASKGLPQNVDLSVSLTPECEYFFDEYDRCPSNAQACKEVNELCIAVIQARDLPAMDRNLRGQRTSSDPLVTIACAGQRASTRVIRKCLDPVWHEVFYFRVRPSDRSPGAQPLSVLVKVDDWDDFSANDFIGQVSMHLDKFKEPCRAWYQLQDRKDKEHMGLSRGAIELAIRWRYNPEFDYFEDVVESQEHLALPPNELMIALIRGRNLPALDRGLFGPASSDPFVKIKLDNEDEVVSSVKKNTLQPIWNERFRLPAPDIAGSKIHFSVFDHDLLSASDFMGTFSIAMDEVRERKAHRRWFRLHGRDSRKYEYCGEMEISLRWIHTPELALLDDMIGRHGDNYPGQSPNCLRIALIRGKSLPAMDLGGTSDPYVNISVVNSETTFDETLENDISGRVISRATSNIQYRTLSPRWNSLFNLQCPCPLDDGSDLGELCPRLLFECLDHDDLGTPDLIGCAQVYLHPLLDRQRRRLWIPLSDGIDGRRSRGEIEIAVQWIFDPNLEPDVIVQIPRLQLRNTFDSDTSFNCVFSVGGFASMPTVSAPAHGAIWDTDDDIFFSATSALLSEKRIDLEVRAVVGNKSHILIGRARFKFPQKLLKQSERWEQSPFKESAEISLNVEPFDGESQHLSTITAKISLAIGPWTPRLDNRTNRQSKVQELVLEAYSHVDDEGADDIFLGRAVIRGGQFLDHALCLENVADEKFRSSLQPVVLPLRARSVREAKTNNIKVRGTITISLLAARSIDFLKRRTKDHLTEGEAIQESSVQQADNAVASVLEEIIDAAWVDILCGRHLRLHIIGCKDLCASRREHRSRQGGNTRRIPLQEADTVLNPYAVAIWNHAEIGRTPKVEKGRSPFWGTQINLPQLSNVSNYQEVKLSLAVYDNEDQVGVEGSLLGQLELDALQIYQLRCSIALSMRQGHPIEEASVSYRLKKPLKEATQDCEEVEEESLQPAPRVRFIMSDMAVAELPDFGSFFFGRRQSPYVRIQLWNSDAKSSIACGGGVTTTWKREKIQLLVDAGLLSEEPLLVQVYVRRTPPLADRLIGEARMRLDELVASGGAAMPVSLPLHLPGRRQQGQLSCSLSYQQDVSNCAAKVKKNAELTTNADDAAGGIRLAVTIDRDAELADAAIWRSKIELESQRLTRKDSRDRETAQSIEERAVVVADEGGEVIPLENFNEEEYKYDPNAYFGIDQSTGLPWRLDADGMRRFFLGFPISMDSTAPDT